MLKEFRAFVLRGNVVDLAVGVVIGAAFSAVVNSFVAGILNPLIGFVGTGDLAKKGFCVGDALDPKTKDCLHFFAYGQIISSIISFVLVAAVVFFFVVKPVNALMAKLKGDTPVDESTRECPKCLSKIPKKASRCAFCTADVGAVA